MKRRAWVLMGWTSGWVAACLLAAGDASAVELRGRSGTRATHRLAALQEEPEPLEAEPSPSDVMPEPETTPPPKSPPRQAHPVPKAMMPIAEPAWDADVIGHPGHGGPCSDGFCEECPTNDNCLGVYGSWGSLEYLLWWRDARATPILVTTTTTPTDPSVDGELGQANTRVLLGPSQFDDHLQPGGRLDVGFWLDRCRSTGVGVRVTALGDDDLNYVTNSSVNPVLAVPFFNLDPTVNSEDTLQVANPDDATTGFVRVTGHNEVYLGDFYARFCGAQSDRYRIDVIGGYGFSRINEDLTLLTRTTSGGTDIVVRDRFRTKNEYHGGVIGLLGEFDRGYWKVNALAKVTLATVTQTQIVDGITTIGDTPQAPLAGLFAQPSNIGRRERDDFAIIPEFGINWMYHVGCGVDLTVGYTAVYWSEAIRPGEQINRRVDPSQTTNRPAAAFVDGEYWAQGFNFGLAWSY